MIPPDQLPARRPVVAVVSGWGRPRRFQAVVSLLQSVGDFEVLGVRPAPADESDIGHVAENWLWCAETVRGANRVVLVVPCSDVAMWLAGIAVGREQRVIVVADSAHDARFPALGPVAVSTADLHEAFRRSVCPLCYGWGLVPVPAHRDGDPTADEETCPECAGTGLLTAFASTG